MKKAAANSSSDNLFKEDREKNAILAKIRKGTLTRSSSRDTSTEQDNLTTKLYHQWEILANHKTTAQEMSKAVEKLVDDLGVVQQDYEVMTIIVKDYYERVQSTTPNNQLAKCLKQSLTLHELMAKNQKMLHEQMSTLLNAKMRYFLNQEFALAREKKKRFDKAKYSYDSANNRKKTKKEKVEPDIKNNYQQVGDDAFATLQSINKAAINHMIDIVMSLQDYNGQPSQVIDQWIREVEPSTEGFREIVTKSAGYITRPVGPLGGPLFFGTSLNGIVSRQGTKIPTIVSDIIQWIEQETQINTEGLYRVSGPKEPLEKTKRQYESDKDYHIPAKDLQSTDVHWICNLLKTFLRLLSDPVIPFSFYNRFVELGDMPERDRILALNRLVRSLPENHMNLLSSITSHAFTIASRSENNKMDHHNLALVLSPSLVHSEVPNLNTMVSDMSKANAVFTTLFQQGTKLFESVIEPEDLPVEPMTSSSEQVSKSRASSITIRSNSRDSELNENEEEDEVEPRPEIHISPQLLRTLSTLEADPKGGRAFGMSLHPIIEKILSPPSIRSSSTSTVHLQPDGAKDPSTAAEAKKDVVEEPTLNSETKGEAASTTITSDSSPTIQESSAEDSKKSDADPELRDADDVITDQDDVIKSLIDEELIPVPPMPPPAEPLNAFEVLVYSNQLQSRKIVSYLGENMNMSPVIMREHDANVRRTFRVSYEPPGNIKSDDDDALLRVDLHPLSQSLYLFLRSEKDWSNPQKLSLCGPSIQSLTRCLEDVCIDIYNNIIKENTDKEKFEKHVEEALTSYGKVLTCLLSVCSAQDPKADPQTKDKKTTRKILDALQLSLIKFTESATNLLWDMEEDRRRRDAQMVLNIAQTVVNSASGILKSLYERSSELDQSCSSFSDLIKKFAALVRDIVVHLPLTASQTRATRELEIVQQSGDELVQLAMTANNSSHHEELKNKLTAIARRLLDAIAKVTDSFADVFQFTKSDKGRDLQVRTQDLYNGAYQNLSQLLFTHADDCPETQKQIMLSIKSLSTELYKLKNGVFSLPDQIKVLEKVVIIGSSVMESIQGLVEECLVSSMSAITESDQKNSHNFAIQLNRLGYALDGHVLRIKFFTSALCLTVLTSEPTHLNLPETVGELSSVVFSIIQMHSSFTSSYAHKDDDHLFDLKGYHMHRSMDHLLYK
ncbi:rho GTPase-activating protein 23 [Planoprotostelium fungivorum]|uniref:Rho GTPase-activating protein 23 n=1 Tax=Planoprotostelium fungivorum TaxID=1890364 RepID=A0A2P6N126_9EUKA|nr:rho GTPase-activating protein 23 [Planoprotostelium fungivorum]